MPLSGEQVLPVVRVGEISSTESNQCWLVKELWGASSVGVIGGAPKCAQDLAGSGHRPLGSQRHGVLG